MSIPEWPEPVFRVLWSRGSGCLELAKALDPEAARVDGNTEDACVRERASLLVRRRTSARFDLVPAAVPVELDLESAEAVVALVGGGPHSRLAANIAARLAEALDVPARMLCAYRTEGEHAEALTVVERLFKLESTLEFRTVQADSASEIVEFLGSDDLAVLGAAAGSWLQRQFFGTGRRLLANVPSGAIVVKDAPRRVFQVMVEPTYVSPLMTVADARMLFHDERLAVVSERTLLGTVSRHQLKEAADRDLVGDLELVTEALSPRDELPDDVDELHFPIPVAAEGTLVGMVPAPEIAGG